MLQWRAVPARACNAADIDACDRTVTETHATKSVASTIVVTCRRLSGEWLHITIGYLEERRMPVLWGVAHAKRLVTITFKGVICRQDIDDCADGIMTPATLSYRKLVDLTQGSLASSPEVMAAVVGHAREHGRLGAMGPLAFVCPPYAQAQHARLFQALSSAADRPLKVFSDAQAAHGWLDTIPPRLVRPREPLFETRLHPAAVSKAPTHIGSDVHVS
jgi:hypothetical protein